MNHRKRVACFYLALLFLADTVKSGNGCGGFLTGPSGGPVTSPNFPSGYGNNQNCEWSIIVPGGSIIHLMFDSFDIQNNRDYLTIYDGESANAAVLQRLTGAPPLLHPIISTSNTMFLKFTSDAYIWYPGFMFSYRSTLAGHCLDPGVPANGTRDNNSDFTPGQTVRFTCTAGYVLVGTADITCQSNLTWSDFTPICEKDPCTDHTVLNQSWRSVDHYEYDGDFYDYEAYRCDEFTGEKWYRFMEPAGTMLLAEEPTSMFRCGSWWPLFMNGPHPTIADGVVSRQVCDVNWGGRTCMFTRTIHVLACSAGHFVYRLPPVPEDKCFRTYCGDMDEDECATNNGGCAENCTNTAIGFTCSCGAGYVLNSDGLACDDEDECATNNGGCAGTCTNTVPGFTCSCGAGYVLNSDGLGCDPELDCSALYPGLNPAVNFGVYQNQLCFWTGSWRTPKLNYIAAKQKCESHGGTLAMIKDEGTQIFLQNHLKTISGRTRRNFWIGLDDLNAEKTFQWNDGTPLGEYNLFRSNAPHKIRDCVILWRTSRSAYWYIKNCSFTYSYICQFGGSGQ